MMETDLRREVSLFGAIVYGVGIILGAGIYALVGEATGITGNALWLSFLLAAAASLFTGISYMELVSIFPESAAEYVYVERAFQNRLLAFIVGWFAFSVSIIAASAVSLGFAGYFHALFGVPTIPVAIGLIILMSLINFWGIGESSKINMIFSFIEIFGLVLIVGIAFFSGSIGSVDYLEMPAGFTGVLSAAALISFAYLGFEDLANIAEEVENGERNVPIAILASVAITTIAYILVSISIVSLVDWRELGASHAPLALVASTVFGEQAFLLMSIIALFATANTVLITLIVGSRMMYGMSRNGSLPSQFSKIHAYRRTPWVAVVTCMVFSILFVMIGNIKTVAGITDFGVFFIFIFVNLSAILLRYRMPDVRRGFRTPLNVGRFPMIPFIGLLSLFLLVTHLTFESIVVSSLLIIAGIFAYFLIGRENG